MLSAHQLAEKSYVNLLDLFLTAETAVTWEYENWEEYGRKRKNVCDSLRLLKKICTFAGTTRAHRFAVLAA